MRRPRRNHSPGFKAKVTMAPIRNDKTFLIRQCVRTRTVRSLLHHLLVRQHLAGVLARKGVLDGKVILESHAFFLC